MAERAVGRALFAAWARRPAAARAAAARAAAAARRRRLLSGWVGLRRWARDEARAEALQVCAREVK